MKKDNALAVVYALKLFLAEDYSIGIELDTENNSLRLQRFEQFLKVQQALQTFDSEYISPADDTSSNPPGDTF
jgi:hypothetical protein